MVNKETYGQYARLVPDSSIRNHLRIAVRSAILRCTDMRCGSYERYGAVGVTVYSDWLKNRVLFFQYLMTLENFSDISLELDRIDNSKGYEPGNLRFVSRTDNMRNRRNTRWLMFNGVRMTTKDFWRQELRDKCSYQTVINRYKEGLSPNNILQRIVALESGTIRRKGPIQCRR